MWHPVIFAVALALLVGLVVGVMCRDRHDAHLIRHLRANCRTWCARTAIAENEITELDEEVAALKSLLAVTQFDLEQTRAGRVPLPRPRTELDRAVANALKVSNAQ